MGTDKKTTYRKASGAIGLLLMAIAFVILILLSNEFLKGIRLDLTENGLYSVSSGTQEILSGIEDPITLKFFFSDEASKKLPSLRIYATRVHELLEEYSQSANDMIELQVIDPLPFSEEEDEAAGYGLRPMHLDRSTGPVYFGLVGLNKKDDAVIIPAFQQNNEEFLEYDLTKLIYTLSNPRRPVIGLLSELPLAGGWNPATRAPEQPWAIFGAIGDMFEVRHLTKEDPALGEDIDVLLLVYPKQLPERTIYAIDQFALSGGRILIFVDPLAETDATAADPRNPFNETPAQRSSNIPRLFAAWGVQFHSEQVVVDRSLALPVSTGGPQPVEHIGMLGLRGEQMNREDAVTGLLSSINIAQAGHFTAADNATTNFEPLLSTTEDSTLLPVSRFFYLADPNSLRDGYEPSGRSYVIAVRISGPVTSAFGDKPPGEPDKEASEHLSASVEPVNIIAVGDADMLADRLWVKVSNFFGQTLMSKFANNGDFVANILDNLSGSSALISIRGRASFSRPFGRVEDLRRAADEQFRTKELELQTRLEETEKALTELQSGQPAEQVLTLTEEQSTQIERYIEQRSQIRKELRQVRHDLDRNIEKLAGNLRLINIALMPVLITLITLGLQFSRRRRQRT
jgi:ABC-type uncharacterized transport system involved in gliding motility auxiliary subunit